MNVLALLTDAYGGQGGIARYNRDLLAALAQDGGDGHIMVLPRQGRAAPSEVPAGVRLLEPRGKFWFPLAALRVGMTEGPFDAIFCGHLNLAPLAAALAGVLGVPLWLQLHGVEAWGPLSRAQIWAAEHAALVTAVSRYTRQRFLRLVRTDPRRVRVLPNTVGDDFAPGPRPDYLVDRHGVSGKRIILTVGRLAAGERYKGQDRVIQALAEIVATYPDLLYLVVGEGDDRQRLEELARRAGVQSNVLFVGMVEPAELTDYYRLAEVFVMPSTQEGFGIVFLEAAASGLRVIGGNSDGSTDALADGVIGLTIDPASPDQLVRAIIAALGGDAPDPAQVRRFSFKHFARHVSDLTHAYLHHRGRLAA